MKSTFIVDSLLVLILMAWIQPGYSQPNEISWIHSTQVKLEKQLVTKYGEAQRSRVRLGLKQLADFWRTEDGDAGVFEDFVLTNFAGDQAALDTMFTRFEFLFEQLDGHMNEIGRAFRWQSDLDLGPILPFDDLFAGYEPYAHMTDDFFANKIAFVVLLNFPLTTLDQRLSEGANWTRRQWAEARLAQRFSNRIPAEITLDISTKISASAKYISEYNIWMHHLLNDNGKRLFPPKLRLLTHWNLRDEIKADYSDPDGGLQKQEMIQQVMERIVTQTIPAVVIDNPNVDWNPFSNEVKPASVKDADVPPPPLAVTNAPEPDTRYAMLLNKFLAIKKSDPYSPASPTLIARRFDEDRELPEPRVQAMLEQILTSPLVQKIGSLIEKRLHRKLEPFDVWYNGFKQRGSYTEAQLDSAVSRKYPTVAAYKSDIPNLLMKLGFSPEKAAYISGHIAVDPARGSGHASSAAMRTEKARLRTRVEKSGMNYKGYNIAVHEMGHNVEQVFSLNTIDHTLLQGVPNTAFTEALAFVFQGHDLELLGLTQPDEKSEAMKIINDFWGAYEIAGVALVDMAAWHWMYDHPTATPTEFKVAVIQISKDIWNKYYAHVFRKKDVVLLGIYSHMIDEQLYLPDYPIGHLIAFQIEEQMKKAGAIGPEFERMAIQGRIAPDIWMKHATGAPVGAEALLRATEAALEGIKK